MTRRLALTLLTLCLLTDCTTPPIKAGVISPAAAATEPPGPTPAQIEDFRNWLRGLLYEDMCRTSELDDFNCPHRI